MKYYKDIFIVAVCCMAIACLFRVMPLTLREWGLIVAVGCAGTFWLGYARVSTVCITPLSALYISVGLILPRYIEVEAPARTYIIPSIGYRYAFILLICIALFYLGRLARFCIEWWRLQRQRPTLP